MTAGLVITSIALSVTLLIGVERVRTQARNSFTQALAGTDLIVGARGGAVNLLLYSVFRIGDATNNVRWKSLQTISAWADVSWSVPISLGDSHRGYPVLGTTPEYFKHYRYADSRNLRLAQGRIFTDLFDAVLGSEIAARLKHKIGDHLILAHGAGAVSFTEHQDKPFTVVGILAATGTPVGRTVHVGLSGIEAIHADWFAGGPIPGFSLSAAQVRSRALTPREVTAVLLGLKSKIRIFKVQRAVNEFEAEPLLAILPALTMQQLWDLLGFAERAIVAISALVFVCGLLVLLTALLTALNERRREVAILRALGARPRQILGLMMGEAALLTLLGIVFGMIVLEVLLASAMPLLNARFAITLSAWPLSARELMLLSAIFGAGLLAGLVPAWRVYRYAVADGLTLRV